MPVREQLPSWLGPALGAEWRAFASRHAGVNGTISLSHTPASESGRRPNEQSTPGETLARGIAGKLEVWRRGMARPYQLDIMPGLERNYKDSALSRGED